MHTDMNRKATSKKNMRRGFMCQPQASVAVCMTGESMSVIVPRTRRYHDQFGRTLIVDHHERYINAGNYTRLIESRRFGVSATAVKKSNSRNSCDTSMVHYLNKHKHVEEQEDAKQMIVKAKPPQQDFSNQVVVMRVSLHCQGCAGKVKKHLSKMEGVTSFSIDLESKRVTVTGNVSPENVLESISKVKSAEFWPC